MSDRKDFSGGWYAEVIPLTFGRARITLCRTDDTVGIYDGW